MGILTKLAVFGMACILALAAFVAIIGAGEMGNEIGEHYSFTDIEPGPERFVLIPLLFVLLILVGGWIMLQTERGEGEK